MALGLAGLAAAAALVATRAGPGLTPDSVTYLSAARNLADGDGNSDFTGGTLTVFPPAYPALLAVGELVGIGALTAARVVNALTAAVVVALAFVLLRRHVRSISVLVGATALVAFSPELLRISRYVASDLSMVALTLAFILVLEDMEKPEQRGRRLAIAGGIVGVALLFRYAAAGLLMAGVVVVAARSIRDGFVAAARRIVGFATVAMLVPAVWLLRNATAGDSRVLGFRVGSDDSPVKTVRDMLATIKHYVFPDSTPNAVALGVTLVVAAGVALAAWPMRRELLERLQRQAGTLFPLATVPVVYAAFLIISRKTVGNDIDARILLPVWIPTIVMAASFVDGLIDASRDAGRRERSRLVMVAGCVLVVVTAARFCVQLGDRTATDYHLDSRSSQELRRELRRLPSEARLLSNDPWRVYAVTRRQPVELVPTEARAGLSHEPVTVAEVKRSLCAGPVYVVWFPASPASGRLPARSLTDGTGLTLNDRHRVDGGDVYEIGRTGDASAPSC